MRKVLVTGGAGFVGRHVTRWLLEQGDDVRVVDSLVSGSGTCDPAAGWPLFEPRDFAGFHFERADCRDWFRGPQRDDGFDLAVHLAAVVGGRRVIERNPLAVAADLSIDAGYWDWARLARPAKTLCFSSSAAYPVQLQREGSWVLLREEMLDLDGAGFGMPDMSYGWAKLTCEYLARLAYERHGLRSVCYRPFSGYGEDQDDHYPFPTICKRALDGASAGHVGVWGSGRQLRDFIHIDDCIRGVASTMDAIDDAGAVNLSTGIVTSVSDLARLAAGTLGYDAVVEAMTDQPEGVFARGGDTGKQKALGFLAEIPVQAGVARVLDHLAAQRSSARR